jgi:hypothetical protein
MNIKKINLTFIAMSLLVLFGFSGVASAANTPDLTQSITAGNTIYRYFRWDLELLLVRRHLP